MACIYQSIHLPSIYPFVIPLVIYSRCLFISDDLVVLHCIVYHLVLSYGIQFNSRVLHASVCYRRRAIYVICYHESRTFLFMEVQVLPFAAVPDPEILGL